MTEACILCGCTEAAPFLSGSDRLFGIAEGTYSLVTCRDCGLVRLAPFPSPEQVAGFYAQNYWFCGGRLQEFYRRTVLRDHVSFAAKALPVGRAASVLDVGCGGGLFLRLMRERGWQVLGLDFSEDAARIACQQNGVRVLVGDLTTVSMEPGSFDLVTMFHVVEHLLDPAAYLSAAARLLRPDGRLIVQVPDRDCWEAKLLGARWTGLDVPRHIHVFRSSDLRRLLGACGFAVVREKHFSLRDHPAGLASSLAPSLDPVARGIRGTDGGAAAVKNLLYLGLTAAALPFTLLEALFGKGSSVMMEARIAAPVL